MNIERMRMLAVHLRKTGDMKWDYDGVATASGYQQSAYTHACGTPACIAGHAVALKHFPNSKNIAKKKIPHFGWKRGWKSISREAAEWLDLNSEETSHLFKMAPDWSESPTAEEAANELERMANEEERRLN